MFLREWFRPPRHLLAAFIVVIVLPAAALGWLAWRTLEQDKALEGQRLRERLEGAATTIVAGLEHRLEDLARELAVVDADSKPTFPEDSVFVVFRDGNLREHPPGRILYYPNIPAGEYPPAGALAAAEALEFRAGNLEAAVQEYRRLARSAQPALRAQALLGLARSLRKGGRHREALETYDELAKLGTLRLDGAPAELLARHARCALLADLRAPQLRLQAAALHEDLLLRRWVLDSATFDFYLEEARSWLPSDAATPPNPAALALSDAVGLADQILKQRREKPGRGWKTAWLRQRPFLILWNSEPERMAALVAGPSFFEQWSPLWKRQNVALALLDQDSHPILGGVDMMSGPVVVRQAAETGLPWTLRVASADPAGEFALLSHRSRVMLAGLALVGVLVLAGGYLVARALSRELAVARLQTDFVAAVSHEFRSPLTSMKHLLEMLEDGAVPAEERRRLYYQVLSRETNRLHRLVESLLNFRRMEAGQAEYRFEPLDVRALVEQVATEFAGQPGTRGRLETRLEGDDVSVSGDREALGRALWNLLDNAAKYSPDSSPILLELGTQAKDVSIRVRDQGTGIPSGEQKEIFRKFYRGSSARESGVKGTGIGLATVQHIIRAHRGEITVESRPGDGSTFTITLPALAATPEAEQNGKSSRQFGRA